MSNQKQATVLGAPIDRTDGPAKVSGANRYAYENARLGETAYGIIVGAGIARGRIVSIDTAAAERVPGVLLVMTHKNSPAQPAFGEPIAAKGVTAFTRPRPVFGDDRIRYFDEPVALVVAQTFEAARGASKLILVKYAAETPASELESRLGEAYTPATANAGYATDSVIGDPKAALASAGARIDAVYRNDFQHHTPIEPHAALARWDNGQLTVHYSGQTVAPIRDALAATLQMPKENIRILSPYIGGGFGSKLVAHAETMAAALAARALARPVKVALTRQQMFANAGHRPAMHQDISLAADSDGKLTAFDYTATMTSARMEEFCEQTAVFARALYAAPNRASRHRLVPVDLRRAEWMRAPGEAPGLLAFECAMDELAVKLGIDPVQLRIVNEPERDPELNIPFSTRRLVECLRDGASRFGWQAQRGQPGTRREGRKLIGQGMSAGIRPNYLRPSNARVRIDRNAKVVVETDMTDIGTGTYTILAQVVADELGVAVGDVDVRLGDSRYPVSPGSGGSYGAGSSGTSVVEACRALRAKLIAAHRANDASPFRGVNADDVAFSRSGVASGGTTASLASFVAAVPEDARSAEGKTEVPSTYKEFSQHTYGAYFAEVEVDADTAEIRVRRMLGVFDAGRILNAKLARSQLIGGMLWGVGAALLEGAEIDSRSGAIMNADLANYHVMAHADVPEIEAICLDGYDDKANPMGSKGIGELGICGAGASVANAVFDATGVRARHFPITVDRLLPELARTII